MDLLDRQIIQGLMIDGRASFSRLAAVLGVTDQTVTRRYRRLRSDGIMRVIGIPAAARVGLFQSRLRLQCVPGSASAVADALARRPDISWVAINAGGAEVACMTRSRSREERDALLLHKLPRTRQVTAVSAQSILHAYIGGPLRWRGLDELSAEQVTALERPVTPGRESVEFDDADRAMLALLSRDGRTGYPDLARAAGRSESTVRRRLEQLRESGVVFYDVDVLPASLGFFAEAALYVTVAPAALERAGLALASHSEVPYAAATTGSSNLFAVVLARDLTGLYEYMTRRIGEIEGVVQMEVVPVLRTVKHEGLLTDGNRLLDPPPATT
ncbi:MAG TPA: Lrp/AsnC family transcriptional regulator [Actinospica sp.]|nr:Lrp/AsnC family transcriptional regulator [Actinospica sp.]